VASASSKSRRVSVNVTCAVKLADAPTRTREKRFSSRRGADGPAERGGRRKRRSESDAPS